MYLAAEYVVAENVSIVVAEVPAVAVADPTDESLSVIAVAVSALERTRVVPVAAPISGVTRVGVLANTRAPLPVSSEITPASSEEDVAASAEILLYV